MNKASGGDGIPAKLFQIIKDDAVKVLYSICQQIWKAQQWPQEGKYQFSFQSQRTAMQKNVQTTETTAYFHMLACEISHASKVILKILQANSR